LDSKIGIKIVKNKFEKLIHDEQGYVYVIVAIIILLSVIYCGISLYEPLVTRDNVFHVASVIVNEIQSVGEIDTEIENMVDALCFEMNISPNIYYEGNFINSTRGTRLIQIGEPFYVNVELTMPITLMDPMFSNPITHDLVIKKRLKGVGQVYWRPSEM